MTNPKIEVLPIAQGATPDANNVNQHTQKGGKLLNNALRKRGAFRSIASAGKGVEVPVVGAGNFTLENAVDAGFTEVINVHVTGKQIVNVVRDDIEPYSPEFYALAIEDNEIGKQSYSPDLDIVAALAAGDSAVLSALRQEDKIFDGLLEGMTPQQIDYQAEWAGMPEFETKDLRAIKQVLVSFASMKDFEDFQELIGQKLTEKAKYVWYPKAEILKQSLVVEND